MSRVWYIFFTLIFIVVEGHRPVDVLKRSVYDVWELHVLELKTTELIDRVTTYVNLQCFNNVISTNYLKLGLNTYVLCLYVDV